MKRLLIALTLAVATLAAPAQASAYHTVAKASDASDYSTFAYLSESVEETYGLRVKVKAPRGKTKVSGSVFCSDEDYNFETRTFGFSYRSTGAAKTRRLPLPLWGAECDVSVNVSGKGGTLRLYLQAM